MCDERDESRSTRALSFYFRILKKDIFPILFLCMCHRMLEFVSCTHFTWLFYRHSVNASRNRSAKLKHGLKALPESGSLKVIQKIYYLIICFVFCFFDCLTCQLTRRKLLDNKSITIGTCPTKYFCHRDWWLLLSLLGVSYEDALQDGVILCKLMNIISPGSINKINPSGAGHFKICENLNK